VLHMARWKCTTQKIAKNSPSGHHRTTLSGNIFATKARIERHVLTIGKKMLNSNISSTCPHNMVNFGLLTAEICWRVLGTPANFNGFHVLASLLQRRPSTRVNQTLHDVWPSPGLVEQRASANVCGIIQRMELRTFAEGAIYIQLDGHHVGHRPIFIF